MILDIICFFDMIRVHMILNYIYSLYINRVRSSLAIDFVRELLQKALHEFMPAFCDSFPPLGLHHIL